MATRIQVRRDTAANWTAVNPTLASGEIGYETDTDKFKIGPGAWNSIATYFTKGAGGGGTWGSITGTLSTQADLQTALDSKVGDTGNETVAGIKTFSSSPIVPTPTTDFQASTKKYVDDSRNSMALDFVAANIGHVNHGVFWIPGTAYTKFYCDALIRPREAGYFVSAGYGGQHCLLFGYDGAHLNGNIYSTDTSTLTSFTSLDTLRYDEWAHVAVGFDNTQIITYINGITSSRVAYAGNRKTTSQSDGTLFIGGSDHNMFGGRIAALRIFEGNHPMSNASGLLFPFRPPIGSFAATGIMGASSTVVNASFLADYRTGRLADQSLGLAGMKHDGYFGEANTSIVAVQGEYNETTDYNRNTSKYPTWVVDPFTYSSTAAAQKTQIASTRIYDDFSRQDVHYGKYATLGLGTTRIGSKTWTSPKYGIINGNACVFQISGSDLAIISDAGTTDKTIIWKRPPGGMVTGVGGTYFFIFRYVDANNYHFLYIDEFGSAYIFKLIAGVQTNMGALTSVGTTWTEAKVVLTGASVETFIDGVSKGTITMTQLLTATDMGMYLTSPFMRISEFGVI